MSKTAKTVLLISEISALLFLTGSAFAQAPTRTPDPPHRVDLREEIERSLRSSPNIAFRAEYKTTADAAELDGAESMSYAMPAPPSAISAQRLSHHPPKAAQKAFAQGKTAQRKSRQAEAVEHFAAAVSLNPLYVEARAELGLLYVFTGEIAKALEQFERASELEPNSTMLHFDRAWALLSLGRAAESEREVRRVLAMNPQAADAHRLLKLALFAQGDHH